MLKFTFQATVPLFHVYDVPTSVAFYRDQLGFEVVSNSEPFDDAGDNYGWAMLQRNDVTFMLNNAYENNVRPAEPEPVRTAAHADTVLYFVCNQLEELCAHLRNKGLRVSGPATSDYGMHQVYLQDPDGYLLCFQRPATAH